MSSLRDQIKARLRRDGTDWLRKPLLARGFVLVVLEQAEQIGGTLREKERAKDRALDLLRALERAYDLSLDLPLRYRPPKPPAPLRRLDWVQAARIAFDVATRLDGELQKRSRCRDRLAALIVLSAILRGGLLRPGAWLALWGALSQGIPRLKRADLTGDHVWIDLQIAEHEELRFYPDIVTLSLLARWTPIPLPQCRTADQLLRKIRTVLHLPALPTANAFSKAAFAPLEDRYGARIPAALFAVASGELNTSPLPRAQWESCLRGDALTRPQAARSSRSRKKFRSRLSLEQSERTLQALLLIRRKGARKSTAAPVRHALNSLLDQAPPPVVHARALWFLDLLKQRRKVSTLQRYNSAIGKILAMAFGDDDPAGMSAGEIETRIHAVLETPARQQDYSTADRLNQFFQFAVNDPRLYWPRPDLDLQDGSHQRTARAAVITGPQIAQTLSRLKHDRLASTAFVLGSRGGLRLSDMEALLVRDVDHGRDGAIRIHPTKEGNIKTAAGRRQIPLPVFLTERERSHWDSFTTKRRQNAVRPDEPFLADGAPLLGIARFDRVGFAKLLGDHLGMRPHDLRHGALSNIALALLAPEGNPTVRKVTGWSPARIRDIRAEFTGRDPLGGTHQLARLAGHRHATTLFGSYIHLADLALGLHVSASQETRPRTEAARMLGVNARSVGKKKLVTLEHLRPLILKKLRLVTIRPVKSVIPPAPPLEALLSPDIAIRLSRMLEKGHSRHEMEQSHAVPTRALNELATCGPLPAPPRQKSDRHWVSTQIANALALPEPAAFVHQIRSMPRHKLRFYAPNAAMRWLNGFGRNIPARLTLWIAEVDDPGPWKLVKVTPVRGPRTRLDVTVFTPSGTNAAPMLHYVANVVDRTLKLRAAITSET